MINKSMERMLNTGTCLAVDEIGKERTEEFYGYGRVFELLSDDYQEFDLCIKKDESWIWSVGKRKSDGKIFASTTPNFYDDNDFECVWLR